MTTLLILAIPFLLLLRLSFRKPRSVYMTSPEWQRKRNCVRWEKR